MKKLDFLLAWSLSVSYAFAQQPGVPARGAPEVAAFSESNPFAKPSTLPYQAPPFDRIKDTDYQPAIEEGMRRELAEIDAIADNPESATFVNTIEAMERS